ncbi:MAG: hypothetical protein EOL91_13145 [Actinobacteria bacterium]|nr:hypothetical protein [Actinomycetota bacterium]
MIKATVKGKLSFPDFGVSLQKELEKVMTQIIRPDIQGRMKSGIDINDANHKPNAPQTKINKFLRGLPSQTPLIATGQLSKSFVINLKGNNAVVMYPAGMRNPTPPIKKGFYVRQPKNKKPAKPQKQITNNQLGDILQNKGVAGHKYEFFGISKKAEEEAIEFMKKKIDKITKDARPRTI